MAEKNMRVLLWLVLLLTAASPVVAQMESMPGMDMPPSINAPETNNPPRSDRMGMNMAGMSMPSTGILGSYPGARDSSGTSWQPDASEQMGGLHLMSGDWMLMGHMTLWGIYDTQSGPRGDDKAFLAGMLMGMGRRDFSGADTLQFRVMLSPDPFMGKNGYPLLLASGETANGATPLIDRQHPHDLFMELAGSYAHRLDRNNSIFLYAADPGEPALGPAAFMHRASGMDIPDAPITHHWLDSTHIVFGVLTAGFVHDDWKLEVSQFTGREPDQNRYDFDPIRLDSTSARVSWNPDPHWSLQVSWGHLNSPEQLTPQINENRTTASATYVTALSERSSFAATLAWGLKQESDGTDLNGVLLEGEYRFDPWTLFARTEWEQNSELDAFGRTRSVGDLTLGAIHDWPLAEHFKLGLGALYAFDFAPSAIVPSYGGNPHGAMAFVRLATR
jgi:hypothetical protein